MQPQPSGSGGGGPPPHMMSQQQRQGQQQPITSEASQQQYTPMPGPSQQNTQGPPMAASQPFLQNRVHLWANQGFPFPDSGVQSGVSSATQSVISGRTSIHDELIGNVSTFSADFANANEQQEAVGGPFQDSAQLVGAIPELLRLLRDPDVVVSRGAAMTVNMLTNKPWCVKTVVNHSELIASVVQLLMTTQDNDTKKHAIGAVYKLSEYREGLDLICAVGGINALVHSLSADVDKIVYYALTCLHNILMHQKTHIAAVRNAGGIQALTQLMGRPQEKVLALIADCLQNMAAQHPESKLQILQHGGTEKTVMIMRQFQYEKLLYMGARLLKVLSVCEQNKKFIIQAGGMQALQRHLQHPSGRLVKHCMITLRNLSDAGREQQGVEDLLVSVINLLGSSDQVIVNCCTGFLFNMSANNLPNKHIMVQHGAVEGLIRTLVTHFNSSYEIAESTLCALRHLTIRHELVAEAQKRLLSIENGAQIVVDLLVQCLMQPNIIKPAIQVFTNLAGNTDNLPLLRELRSRTVYNNGNANVCMNLIESAATTIQLAVNHMKQIQMPNQDMMQLIKVGLAQEQVCISLLHAMSRDELVRQQMRSPNNMLPLLIQLLHSGEQGQQLGVQRAACATLNELALDVDSIELFDRENLLNTLAQLAQHMPDDRIRDLCGSINQRVSDARERAQMQMMAPGLAMFSGGGGADGSGADQSAEAMALAGNTSMNTPPHADGQQQSMRDMDQQQYNQQLQLQQDTSPASAATASMMHDAGLDSPGWMAVPPATPTYSGQAGAPSPVVQPKW